MRRSAKGCALGLIFAASLSMSLQLFGGEDRIPQDIRTMKNPLTLSDAIAARAAKTYLDNCMQCHGEKGKGDGPMAGMLKEPPADLTSGPKLAKMTDGELFWNVTKGKIPVMPAFEPKLSNEERWGLVHFLRDLSRTKSNNTPRAEP